MRIFVGVLITAAAWAGSWTDLGPGTNIAHSCGDNVGAGCGGSVDGCTSAKYWFDSQCKGKVRAWSGAQLIMGGSRLWVNGGGHSDYLGNEITEINLIARSFRNVYSPACFNFASGTSTPCAYTATDSVPLADGSPAAAHTYSGFVCVDRKQYCYSMFRNTPGGTVTKNAWRYPYSGTASTDWLDMGPATPMGTNSPNVYACADDAANDRMLCVIGDGPTQSWACSYDTGDCTLLGQTSGGPFAFNAAYDSARKRMVIVGATTDVTTGVGKIGYINMGGSDYSYHDMTATADATCHGWIVAPYPGIAYDPTDGAMVGKSQALTGVYVLNQDTWTCSVDDAAGAPSSIGVTASDARGMFGRWAYSQAKKGVVLLQDYNQNVYLYRRAASGMWPLPFPTGRQ